MEETPNEATPGRAGKRPIRAVAVDLDDTILRPDKSISERTLETWELCRARGVKMIIATARSEQASARHVKSLKPDACLFNAGAVLRIGPDLLWESTFSPSAAAGLLRELKKAGTGLLMAETKGGCFWNVRNGTLDPEYGHVRFSDFSDSLPPVYKLTCDLAEEATARKIAEQWPETLVTGYFGERRWRFSPEGAEKMTGLRRLLSAMGLQPEETAAFGDDYSDESMLAGVGWGIAMGNAVEQVKKAAREVTDDCRNDGVARWLERNILEERNHDGHTR